MQECDLNSLLGNKYLDSEKSNKDEGNAAQRVV